VKKVLIGLVVLVVIGVGAFALAKDDNKKDSNTTNNTTKSQPSGSTSSTSKGESASTTPPPAQAAGVITYSNNGFSPQTLSVKSGDTVTIKNTSSNSLQFNSAVHPQHTDNPELNVGVVAAGESQTLKVTTKGTIGYHNHLNPGDTGTLTVQ